MAELRHPNASLKRTLPPPGYRVNDRRRTGCASSGCRRGHCCNDQQAGDAQAVDHATAPLIGLRHCAPS